MILTKIEPDYRITLPETLRTIFNVGDEVIITTTASGIVTLTPKNRVLEILERTAGIWAGRDDVPADGVDYVNELRPGRRLREL